MSKITALLTVLALGSSASVAMASPSRTHDRHTTNVRTARAPDRVERSRGVAADDFGPRRYRPTWTALGAPLQLTRAGRESVQVNDRGTFTQLRLADLGGTARVDRVIVQFADGTSQIEDLRRVLDDGQDYLELALDGNNRRIECITVLGASGAAHNLQVYAI
jgi:hypothetical protein